jgi:hypothetical protein
VEIRVGTIRLGVVGLAAAALTLAAASFFDLTVAGLGSIVRLGSGLAAFLVAVI